MNKGLFYFVIWIPLFLISCVSNKVIQGNEGRILGVVTYERGNQMPGPNKEIISKGVKREIFFFEVLNAKDVKKEGTFYDVLNAQPILITQSNTNGEFEVFIKEGIYTLLTKEDKGFYAALLDKDNNLNPIVVKGSKTTEVVLLINYNAYY